MPKHQIIMGCGVAALSLIGLWKADWLIEHTRKGAWLRERVGLAKAGWIFRGFFLGAAVFGALLATNTIRPLQW